MNALAKRISRLESAFGMGCACEPLQRPAIAVTLESSKQWDQPHISITREGEAAKLAYACPIHGVVGPGVHVTIASFGAHP